ncbi:transaldolase [Arcobacter sp. FWKO B]|uniref:transaldolase n=1 Tax=Arcobacter sp. FWKO B TaxID=2593672 RepID=UPI0018A3CEC5|nr:transaldolase [Arcobacter sp. FWKO B]QOG11667.1 transaldolase [Arcobacter sp. FWKO B]
MNLRQNINYSIWCDFIERDFLENEFKTLISDGIIHGATSNPAIFENSITNSPAYKNDISSMQHLSQKEIYEALAIKDIKRAAEILLPLYEKDSNDGFISIEVDPTLCDDMMGTIEEGVRLFKTIDMPNVMIKVPATIAGYGAMRELTSMGINVNATLIFTPNQAIECAKALDIGIKKSTHSPKAVISVFVSRFDRACDELCQTKGLETAKLGIINATKCYHEVEKFANSNIRTLFASTGVKGDDLPKSYYIDTLIYPNSINTAPLDTIKAFISTGKKQETKLLSLQECDTYLKLLNDNGIDIEAVSQQLLSDGLGAFKVSFAQMLNKLKN